MPSFFPSYPVQKVELVSFTQSESTMSHNLIQWVRTNGSHRWVVNLKYIPMKPLQHASLMGAILALRGNVNPVFFLLPAYSRQGVITTQLVQVDGADQLGTSINVKGLPISTNSCFAPMDLVRFSNSQKVYAITEAVNSNAAGKGTLKLSSTLVVPSTNNEIVCYSQEAPLVADRLYFQMRLAESTHKQIRETFSSFNSIEISFMEQL